MRSQRQPIPLDAETVAHEAPRDHKAELRLWLRLLTCCNLIEGEIRTRLRQRFDATLPRFDLMAQLARSDKELSLGEVSQRLMVTNGNITALVERLVEQGHVRRRPAPGDRRVQLVRLTRRGRAAFDEMAAAHADWIAELFADLDPAEIDRLMALLAELKGSVRRAKEANGGER